MNIALTEASVSTREFFAQALMTVDSMQQLIARCPIQLDQELHCTIIYSTKPVKNIELPEVTQGQCYFAKVKEFHHWAGTGNGFIVALLDSEDLQTAHKLFRDVGIIPTFPDYKPHITLVHPVPDVSVFQDWLTAANESLVEHPLVLELYWGGINLKD